MKCLVRLKQMTKFHKLSRLPGTGLSPEVLLHQILEDRDNIKAVTIVVEWKDTKRSVAWSDMPFSEACTSSKVLDYCMSKELEKDD